MSYLTTRTRMFDIARRRGLTHLGSCMSALPILYKIYKHAAPDDVVVVSCGHAGLALYCCLEEFRGQDADALYDVMGTHPERSEAMGVHCSTGSLGCGLAVAVGYAMAGKRTHVLISDGECAEGIIWETFSVLDDWPNLPIDVYVNANGWGAYRAVDVDRLSAQARIFYPKAHVVKTSNAPFPETLDAHYKPMEQQPCDEPSPSAS